MFWKRRRLKGDELDEPLLHFDRQTPWTLRDAFEGCCILGGNGSGKTSSSGTVIAESYLRKGWGGCIMLTKPDEADMWRELCAATGRSGDLVFFGPEHGKRFNFLNYEMNQPGGAGQTENLVKLASIVTEVGERGTGERNEGDPFWKRSYVEMLKNAVDAIRLGGGQMSIPALYDLITDAPQSLEEADSEAWQKRSSLYAALVAARDKAKSPQDENDLRITARYWLQFFPSLAEKTRSIIVSTFTGVLDSFNRGVMRTLFGTDTNLTPEDAQQGRIIVIDMPVKVWNDLGRYAQVVWKFLFQRATERRKSKQPVFLWADEAANFVTSYDALFQSTSRSARCATVFLCQNLPLYYTAMGGETTGKAAAEALIACMGTKIFHANSCAHSNEFAANLIGKRLRLLHSTSMPHQQGYLWDERAAGNPSSSVSEHMEFKVMPSELTTLKKGGVINNRVCEALVFQNGRIFPSTGDNFMFATFRQKG